MLLTIKDHLLIYRGKASGKNISIAFHGKKYSDFPLDYKTSSK
jgi:hypothetical protein